MVVGGATNSHSGNRAFRALVKRYQDQYLQAKKRDKPNVASKIVDTIRSRGGRFLRRLSSQYNSRGEVLWIDIGNDRAREKTCQALREGAPQIRKKRKSSFADERDIVKNPHGRETFSPSLECTHLSADTQKSSHLAALSAPGQNFSSVSNDSSCLQAEDDDGKDSSIMIRPSIELITDHAYSEAISVDQLEPHERVLYLRDFLPPDPSAVQRRAETFLPYQYNITRIEGCDSYPCSPVGV